ncbi:hypothetical protein [Okeania sp. SIO3B5]|nr:hypothetical protein [Okeania sp. SIO3B5]
MNFLRIYLKSNNYNVGVSWYLWNEAIAEFDRISNLITIEQ